MDSSEPERGEGERPGRPWAAGVGLLLLGLAVSAASNALAMEGKAYPLVQALGVAGYLLGLGVSGAGVHRVLWAFPTPKPIWARVLLTAVVTLPTFVAAAILLSVLLTVTQVRFG